MGTNCVLLNTQIGLGQNPFVQINPASFQQNVGINLNQAQPQFSFGNFNLAGRTSNQNVQVLEPNSNPGMRQEVPAGAKPWLLDPNLAAAMELELVTEPDQTILEPVLRNQYLTKLKRLLPTFFEDFKKDQIESILLGKNMNMEVEEEPPKNADMTEQSYSDYVYAGSTNMYDDDAVILE